MSILLLPMDLKGIRTYLNAARLSASVGAPWPDTSFVLKVGIAMCCFLCYNPGSKLDSVVLLWEK